MSREQSRIGVTGDLNEGLEVIREEFSPGISQSSMNEPKPTSVTETVSEEGTQPRPCDNKCVCLEQNESHKNKLDPEAVEKLLKQKEQELTAAFEQRLHKEIYLLKDRCDYVLLNEQIRASHMLREAHRERQEKITALQTQLECKHLAGLMFVVCTERRRSKLDKLRIIQDYTTYIHGLQDILTEAQELILHLSKGYRTAARVDHEWREKMKIILREFQMFINDFAGGSDDTNQFFFDLPALLKIQSPIVDYDKEDPCEPEEKPHLEEKESKRDLKWWEQIDGDCRPFVMFGDMADFVPNQRRQVLKTVKANKTVPKKWKEYVFHDMFLKSNCPNADVVKDEYPDMRHGSKWECHLEPERPASKTSFVSRQTTRASVDIRGNMGSILKMITSTNTQPPAEPKPNLLGARDSMEIVSTTKLKEKVKLRHQNGSIERSKVVINLTNRRTSFFDETLKISDDLEEDFTLEGDSQQLLAKISKANNDVESDKEPDASILGSVHNDSLQMIGSHTPDPDHKIHYEKNCPVDKCQRLHVDSFMRSLPPYMRANPYTHFEQSFEEYETCSPEQLDILQQRIQKKKKREKVDLEAIEPSPFEEWKVVPGVGVQTSDLSLSLPPCTCRAPSPSLASSDGKVFNLLDLVPVKQALDRIHEECFFDDTINFDRFKVLGQDSHDSLKGTFKNPDVPRLNEIKRILKVHPSLLDIFQGNQQC